jgi:hypothetical protein
MCSRLWTSYVHSFDPLGFHIQLLPFAVALRGTSEKHLWFSYFPYLECPNHPARLSLLLRHTPFLSPALTGSDTHCLLGSQLQLLSLAQRNQGELWKHSTKLQYPTMTLSWPLVCARPDASLEQRWQKSTYSGNEWYYLIYVRQEPRLYPLFLVYTRCSLNACYIQECILHSIIHFSSSHWSFSKNSPSPYVSLSFQATTSSFMN